MNFKVDNSNNIDNELGFIILRHVNSERTNNYWIDSYNSIRKYYPENDIVILDDNSNYNFITNIKLYNAIIVDNEYKGIAELAPYIYYIKYKWFKKAMIIHDSVFINKYIDLNNIDKYKILLDFEHSWDQVSDETRMILEFNNKELLEFYNNKKLWDGCFGGMVVINLEFLTNLNKKYNLTKLIKCIQNRYNRMSFERVIGCLLQKEAPKETLLGNLHKYFSFDYKKWEIYYDEKEKYNHLELIKVWTGR